MTHPPPAADPFPAALAAGLDRLGVGGRDGDAVAVAAVSGGADSTALLCGLAELRSTRPIRLSAAHLDHAVRPDSAADAAFVAALCDELDVPLFAETRTPGGTSEAALREDRLAFYRRAASVGRAFGSPAQPAATRWILTGHTADDQTETVLHRIVRGTGLGGLAGMPERRPLGDGIELGRPMSRVTRDVVVGHLRGTGRTWREDATNRDEAFTRNRIRHSLRPLLRAMNPRSDEAVRRLADAAAEAAVTVDALAAALADRLGPRVRGDGFDVPAEPLAALPPPARRAVLRHLWRAAGLPEGRMNRPGWERLADAAGGAAGVSLPGGVDARRAGGLFRCRRGR